jgi:hypothetical protein
MFKACHSRTHQTLCQPLYTQQKHLIIDGPIHKQFFYNMFNNECIQFFLKCYKCVTTKLKIGIVAQTIFQNTMGCCLLQIHGIHSKIIVPMSVFFNALSAQCCKPFSRLSFIYNSILSFLYTFIFSLYNYSDVC